VSPRQQDLDGRESALTDAERAHGAWIDPFGRKRLPTSQEFEEDDGKVLHGQDAIQAGMRMIDEIQDHNRRLRRQRPDRPPETAPAVAANAPRERNRERRPTGTRRSTGTSWNGSSDDDPPGSSRRSRQGVAA
jgi:hypothetical protein